MNNQNLITVTSELPFDAVCERLPTVATRHRFSVLGEHDLRQKLGDKGFDLARSCRVFDVCSPPPAFKVLSAAIEVSSVLPCRIAVWQEGDGTVLATIRPDMMLGMFGHEELAPIAKEVGESLTAIMRECASASAEG